MKQPLNLARILKRRMDAKWRTHDRAIQHGMPPAMIERTFCEYLDALEALSRVERANKREL